MQTDANSDKLSFEYDALGRKTTLKINNVVDSEWHYNTDKPWRLDQDGSYMDTHPKRSYKDTHPKL